MHFCAVFNCILQPTLSNYSDSYSVRLCVGVDIHVKFGDSESNRARDIRAAHSVMAKTAFCLKVRLLQQRCFQLICSDPNLLH